MKYSILALLVFSVLNLSSQSSYSQNEQKMRDGITTVYETIFSTGDFTDIEKYIDANMVDHNPDPGQAQGIEGLKGAFKDFRTAFPDLKFKIIEIIVSGNKAVIHSNITGTNTGQFMGMPPTNKKVDYNQVDIVYFNSDNKAIERWGYFDFAKFMQQLGLMK
jgi:predicted ester cyclase